MFIYKCAICKKKYESVWSNEEAIEERKGMFGDLPDEAFEVVCDDCYHKLLRGESICLG